MLGKSKILLKGTTPKIISPKGGFLDFFRPLWQLVYFGTIRIMAAVSATIAAIKSLEEFSLLT